MNTCCIVILAVVASCSAYTYPPDTQNLDINTIVNDINNLKSYIDCFNDKGECNVHARAFKSSMPEAIQEACAKCTDPQKLKYRTFLEAVKEKLPADYEFYKTKYDAENKYFPSLIASLAKA